MNKNNDRASNGDLPMTFGKYVGKLAIDLPSDYISWCLMESSVLASPHNRNLRESLEDELITRLLNSKTGNKPVDDFVLAYDKVANNAELPEYEFNKIISDELYKVIKQLK